MDTVSLLKKNELEDLQMSLRYRKSLNKCNIFLTYIYHAVQMSGVFITMIGNSYKKDEIVWLGVGVNILSQLIYISEKINERISNGMLKNIVNIRDGNYVDEEMVSVDSPPLKGNNALSPKIIIKK